MNIEISDKLFAEALSERYLAYAISTIAARSLPDVRDGLKPVHRRLLFAMRQLKLDPQGSFKKCARVVGDVIGKYHPHGDAAVYETMVRLAQDFAVRYPLVEGQGNFGNIDGDNAAAMRYTEAKLTKAAQLLLDGLDENAVDFRPNYDGSEEEPVVLPASFPNLLANGASGIAVGMATSIPPHNVGEIAAALLLLLDKPEASLEEIIAKLPAPDFPTGGVLVEARENVIEAYKSGRGSFRLRARWEIERLSHGLYQIVVTEIPYQVKKGELVEKIAELLLAKKLSLLADVRDESAENIRLVLEPKNRAVAPEMLMEQLFRATSLEIKVPLNLNVLEDGVSPRVMNLKEVLQAFIRHRLEVLLRRSNFRLEKINNRLEILAGFLVVYLNLDEVIRIIREEDEPKAALMKHFQISEIQAEAILNMRLRSLRKLEEMEIKRELSKLEKEKAEITALLADEKKRIRHLAKEIKEMAAHFVQDSRRTLLGEVPAAIEIPDENEVEREDISLILSKQGWIRAVKGHTVMPEDLKFKEGDELLFLVKGETTSKFIFMASNGRAYTLSGDKLPRGRGHGEPLRLSLELPNDAQIINIFPHLPGRKLIIASNQGRGFAIEESELLAQTKNGKQIMNLGEDESTKLITPLEGDMVAIIGENRKLLVFKAEEIPFLNKGRGVILQKYKQGGLSDLKSFHSTQGLSWQSLGRLKTETNLIPWQGHRGDAGLLPPVGFPRDNKFC